MAWVKLNLLEEDHLRNKVAKVLIKLNRPIACENQVVSQFKLIHCWRRTPFLISALHFSKKHAHQRGQIELIWRSHHLICFPSKSFHAQNYLESFLKLTLRMMEKHWKGHVCFQLKRSKAREGRSKKRKSFIWDHTSTRAIIRRTEIILNMSSI